MPKPPAAFSPLTMTQSRSKAVRNFGNSCETTMRPARPTTSPMNRRRMHSSRFAVDPFALREHEIKPLVVSLGGKVGYFLHRIGDADRGHLTRSTQLGERSIVEA